MRLYLASEVFGALVGEDVVLLDTRADTYLCVPEGRARMGLSPDGALSGLDLATGAALEAAGLATCLPALCDRTVPASPCRSLAFDCRARLRRRDVLRLAACVIDLVLHYRGRSLPDILDFIACRRRSGRVVADSDLETVVGRFNTALIWLPDTRKCLVRSFVLLCFLHRSGWDAQWVFGVRTWPFGAHCWLQAGDVLLDDAVEHLSNYTPIRVA